MPENTARICVQADKETKQAAEQVLADCGLTMSAAINIFLRQVVLQNGIPFPITQNKTTNTNKEET